MEDDIIKEFFSESREHLATIETDLLAIEEAGEGRSEELVNKVFRAAHSIKGGSGFFGLALIKELSHHAETVLDLLRTRQIAANAEVTNLLLAAFDQLRVMIDNPVERENADIAPLVAGLIGLTEGRIKPGSRPAPAAQAEPPPVPPGVPPAALERARKNDAFIYEVSYDLIRNLDQKGLDLFQSFEEIAGCGEILDCQLDFAAVGDLDSSDAEKLPLKLTYQTAAGPQIAAEVLFVDPSQISVLFDPASAPAAPSAPQLAALPAAPVPGFAAPVVETPAVPLLPAAAIHAPAAVSAGAVPATAGEDTLRVSVDLLETLMNLAGELVLSRNQLRAAIARQDAQLLAVADQRFNQITSELQEAIMRTRLQPMGNVFAKFPRVVRDLANLLHKDIALDVHGKEVALDRSLIEGLSDPLTHMVRNAVDHGLETPEVRTKAGKKPQGTVRIEARHEAGQVVVEISDDGKGIDPDRVAAAALAKGLITSEQIRTMSVDEKIALVMMPGLSTAAQVTDLSGRGVGMDVVKTNLERMGGKIEIKSVIGQGSLFRIKLPLTLAIIPSLIVSVGSEHFAIPQINVEELLQIRPEEIKERIEYVGGSEVLLLREKILPLVHLGTLLGIGARAANAPLAVAVVTTGSLQYGLAIDAFHETEEIVVKPLGQDLKSLGEYAGATILGDGAVALILDVAGVAAKAQFASVTGSPRADASDAVGADASLENLQSLLLFRNPAGECCGIPLDSVLRIERTTPKRIELTAGRRTIQYRGAVLPLVTVGDSALIDSLPPTQDLAVIVASVHGREVGLIGAMPVDVVTSKADIDQITHRQPGISGSVIVRDRTTLIADVFELVGIAYPEWSVGRGAPVPVAAAAPAGAPADARTTILLAEDSDFFRSQVKKYLVEDGFIVLDAPDGEAAWELLGKNVATVKVILTDIEMPRLTGLELARRVRADNRFDFMPIIALSSLAGDEDMAKGRAAGVDHYLVKLDRDRLLAKLHSIRLAA